MIRKSTAALLLAFLMMAACGRGEDPTLTVQPTPDDTSATPSPEPLDDASCETQTGGNRDAGMFLNDVQVTSRGTYDRIVFEFEPQAGQSSQVPWFQIEPTEPPLREAGSGREVEVQGDAYLEMIIWATGVDIQPDEPRAVYTGPRSHRPEGTTVIEEVRESGDFENTMTWHVGMTQAACFRVIAEESPVRVIVDIDATGTTE